MADSHRRIHHRENQCVRKLTHAEVSIVAHF